MIIFQIVLNSNNNKINQIKVSILDTKGAYPTNSNYKGITPIDTWITTIGYNKIIIVVYIQDRYTDL